MFCVQKNIANTKQNSFQQTVGRFLLLLPFVAPAVHDLLQQPNDIKNIVQQMIDCRISVWYELFLNFLRGNPKDGNAIKYLYLLFLIQSLSTLLVVEVELPLCVDDGLVKQFCISKALMKFCIYQEFGGASLFEPDDAETTLRNQ